MFGSLSFHEIFFILVLALLIFGPKRLPQIGRTIGRALGEFRRASSEFKRSVEVEMSLDEEQEDEQDTDRPAPRLEAARDSVSRGRQESGSPPGADPDDGREESGAGTVPDQRRDDDPLEGDGENGSRHD